MPHRELDARVATAIGVLVSLAAGVLLGGAMRLTADLAGSAWARESDASAFLMSLVNLGALWLVVLAVAPGAARLAPIGTALLGAAEAWLALSIYYGLLVPRLPHELLWFALGVPVVAVTAALLAALPGQLRWIAVGLLLAVEPVVAGAWMLSRNGPAGSDLLLWSIELLIGGGIVWWATARRFPDEPQPPIDGHRWRRVRPSSSRQRGG